MPPANPNMTPGRRLRLDRRKAGLSQEGLAEVLGVDKDTVSQMENNRLPLSTAAKAFSASPPARVPAEPRAPAPAPSPADEPLSGLGAEDKDGPGPRVGPDASPERDAAPRPAIRPAAAPREGEIKELEEALLKLFAGEAFLVPRPQPDGSTIQVEAVIPGLAQMVGMVDEFDGQIIRTYAPGMARAWADLARVNPTVRRVLMGLTFGGAYRGVIAATLPATLAIMAHHGMLPQLGGGPTRIVEQPHAPEPPPDGPLAAVQLP
jgi:transcriptional regulator with XRE-family HTH domain